MQKTYSSFKRVCDSAVVGIWARSRERPFEPNLYLILSQMSPIIEGKIEDGVLLAALGVNRLDASSSRDFKKQVEAIWSPEVSRVELDLEKVDFIDSSGVGALLGVYKRLPGDEPNVRLKRVQAPVQSVIELLRLHRIFDISN